MADSSSIDSYLRTPIVQAMGTMSVCFYVRLTAPLDWVGFVALSGTAATLAYRLFTFVPPNSDVLYFFGSSLTGKVQTLNEQQVTESMG